MSRYVEKPLIGIPTSEDVAERILTDRIDMTIIGIEREKLARCADNARAVRRHIEIALSGSDRAMVERCLDRVHAVPKRISLEFVAVLAYFEVNAATWLAIQDDLEYILVPKGRDANVMPADEKDDVINPHVHFGHGRYRLPGGILDMPIGTLPATLMIAAVGRPLSQIVSQEALNGFDHTVLSVTESDGCLQLIYGYHHPTIALADLRDELMWPNPDAMKRIHNLAHQLRDRRSEDMIEPMTTTPA